MATVFAVASAVYVQQLPPRYTATGLLMIDSRQITIPELASALSNLTIDGGRSRSEAEVLRSRTMAERVARELSLVEDPEFNWTLRPPGLRAQLNPGRWLPTAWVDWLHEQGIRLIKPPPTPERGWNATVNTVADFLTVRTDDRSYVLSISFESEKPATAAAVVNTVMEFYVADQIGAKVQASSQANSWLNARLEELKQDVQAADAKVQEYRTRNGLLETRAGTVSFQQLSDINTQLGMARAELARLEANYSRAQDMTRRGGTEIATVEVLASPLIQRLRDREAEVLQRLADLSQSLGERHPQRQAAENELRQVRSRIEVETGKVVSALAAEVSAARARTQALERKLAELEGNANKTASAEVVLNQFIKEADAKRQVYETFLARVEQTSQQAAVQMADARIISPAVPPNDASSPRVTIFVSLATLIGLLLASGFSVLRDQTNDRFASLAELTSFTGLPAFGAVPSVGGGKDLRHSLPNHVVSHPMSAAAETLRGIRVNLNLTLEQVRSKIVLVTSALPEDGKTTFASALARLSALDGQRVLVIDGDLRRPRLGKLLGAEEGPGIDDVLAGNAELASAVRFDSATGLYYLPARGGAENTQQLLESRTLRRILADASREFDLILVDSPPVIRVPDSVVLAKHCDAVILVVGWKRTRRGYVMEALNRLRPSKDLIMGTVLTNVAGTMPEEYYYSGYSRPRLPAPGAKPVLSVVRQ